MRLQYFKIEHGFSHLLFKYFEQAFFLRIGLEEFL
jgi:hypothetical protein